MASNGILKNEVKEVKAKMAALQAHNQLLQENLDDQTEKMSSSSASIEFQITSLKSKLEVSIEKQKTSESELQTCSTSLIELEHREKLLVRQLLDQRNVSKQLLADIEVERKVAESRLYEIDESLKTAVEDRDRMIHQFKESVERLHNTQGKSLD